MNFLKYLSTSILKGLGLYLLLIFMGVVLGGCGRTDNFVSVIKGYVIKGYVRTCVDGVEYLQFTSGASVAYTEDGKIKTCK